MSPEGDVLTRFIDEVSAHLGRTRGKDEDLRELRSSILDRAEELGSGVAGDTEIRAVLNSLGDPAEVALAYSGERYLVAPRMYRPFVIYTGILFAIHLVMILAATAMDAAIEIFPVNALKVARPESIFSLLAVVVQALLMDIGLMVVLFTLAARSKRTLRSPTLAFRVHAGTRISITRAILAGLILIILNFFRDSLIVVRLADGVHPLFTPAFSNCLVPINIFLGLILIRELAFARYGERKLLLLADAMLSAAGAGLMIWLLTQPTFLSLPIQVNEAIGNAMPTLNQLLARILKLLLIAFAAVFAVEAAKRAIRFIQL
jgi:HAAS